MKKLCSLIVAIALVLCCSTAMATLSFNEEDIISKFNANCGEFFSTLGMDSSSVSAISSLCKLTKNRNASSAYGVSVYTSTDNHVVFIAEDFIYSYAPTSDISALKNIAQMALPYTMMDAEAKVPFSLLEGWVTDSYGITLWTASKESDAPFKGTVLDAYEHNQNGVRVGMLILEHGKSPSSISISTTRLDSIAQSIVGK